MAYNVGGMASKGERVITYQVTRKVEAGCNLRIALEPLLAIPRVASSFFIISSDKSQIYTLMILVQSYVLSVLLYP